MARRWPLHSYLGLGALPGAVPCARLHARELLWEWGLTDISDSVELIVSELATNAIKANRAMREALPIRLWVLSDKTRVVGLVWDRHPRHPMLARPGDDADSGRGLMLVEALSDKWGWYPHPDIGGKIVWSEIRAELPPQGSAASEEPG